MYPATRNAIRLMRGRARRTQVYREGSTDDVRSRCAAHRTRSVKQCLRCKPEASIHSLSSNVFQKVGICHDFAANVTQGPRFHVSKARPVTANRAANSTSAALLDPARGLFAGDSASCCQWALLATRRSGPPAFDDVLVAARSAGGSGCHWHPGPGPNRPGRPPGT